MRELSVGARQELLGFDHIDVRVSSLSLVEDFYDQLMPLLGFARKRTAFVDREGEWLDAGPNGEYNTVEYYTPEQPGVVSLFIGFIERADHVAGLTRIAFRVAELSPWRAMLEEIGARNIEMSEDMSLYPAIFFQDPAGTKLELVARRAAMSA
jgi:catechol 2,3-dioxygenase-like lactoylglutathione lyase family enzyme